MKILTEWFLRHFSDPQVVFLSSVLLAVFAVIVVMGDMLAPVLASIVLAYLLEGPVGLFVRRGMPRLPSVVIVFVFFLLFVTAVLIGVLPLVLRQVADLVQQLPTMISDGTQALYDLPKDYPQLVTPEQLGGLIDSVRAEAVSFGQQVLSWSLASVVGVITVLIYLILMPLLLFFFMKDKELILEWFKRLLPKHRDIADHVWHDVDRQISNYVRGKAWEILIAWVATYVTFEAFSLKYAMLLSLLVGLSVIIPYIGAAVVTVPVLLVAWFQWGWTDHFIWLMVAYFIIHALDGNVLVPLLFSEVVNLHPVAIIVAILFFGGIWGFWGVFFAIPLATLVQATLSAWPRRPGEGELIRG